MDGSTSENPLAEGLDDLVLALDCSGDESPERAAVLLVDDDVVGDIDKTTGKVTCVSGLQRRVGKTLTRTVRRDEVFEHRHSLLKVGGNRVLDNLRSLRS